MTEDEETWQPAGPTIGADGQIQGRPPSVDLGPPPVMPAPVAATSAVDAPIELQERPARARARRSWQESRLTPALAPAPKRFRVGGLLLGLMGLLGASVWAAVLLDLPMPEEVHHAWRRFVDARSAPAPVEPGAPATLAAATPPPPQNIAPPPVAAVVPLAAPADAPPEVPRPSLIIKSTPSGASVLVKGKAVGTTPWSSDTPAGLGVIELRLAGYRPWKGKVAAGKDATFSVKLKKLPHRR